MGFSYVASAKVEVDASGTTADMESSLNVAAGDLLVAWVANEDGTSTLAIAKNSGSPANAFTFDAGDYLSASVYGSLGYLLSASADATATFRVTWGTARGVRRALIMQFRPDTGDVVTKDTSAGGTGSDNTAESGDITTTGTDAVVVAGAELFNGGNTSSEQINEVAADGVLRTETGGSYVVGSSIWYRILTNTFTGGHAQCVFESYDSWICGVAAFKAVPGVVPVTPSRLALQQRMG